MSDVENDAANQEELKAIEDAAFNAEMSDTPISLPDANAPKDEAAKTDTQNQATTSEETKRVEVIPGWTQGELEGLKAQASLIPKLQKALDTTNGTYGQRIAELQRTIESLRAQQQPQQSEQGSIVSGNKLTADRLKRISEEYPELASALAEDLNDLVTGVRGGGNIDVDSLKQEIDARVNSTVASLERKFALKRLADKHDDYTSVAQYEVNPSGLVQFHNQEFGNWVSTQPRETQDVILNSDDPDEISQILDKYKESVAHRSKTIVQDDPADLIRRAVQPKGAIGNSLGKTDKELEDEAFAAEMAS